MTIDPVAQALHHKSALGGVLTPEEQERLQNWYAENDAEEMAMLAKSATPPADLDRLRNQVEELGRQIVITAQKIQIQEEKNERIRKENEDLQRKLAEKPTPQPA